MSGSSHRERDLHLCFRLPNVTNHCPFHPCPVIKVGDITVPVILVAVIKVGDITVPVILVAVIKVGDITVPVILVAVIKVGDITVPVISVVVIFVCILDTNLMLIYDRQIITNY